MQKEQGESTEMLLRVIVALLLRAKVEQPSTLRQQIAILYDLGVKPANIADILGRTNTYINKELTGIRKLQKREK